MADNSNIEWCDATWNPIRGCSRVSPGCGGPNGAGGCYAEKIAARFSDPGQAYHGLARRTPNGGQWTGEVRLIPEQLEAPLHWKKPRRIFVNSMSDMFHENLPVDDIVDVFAVMALAERHTMQVLTKRSGRARDILCNSDFEMMVRDQIKYEPQSKTMTWPLPNVWLGVSVEDQDAAEARIPDLLSTPATVRFLSCEPLLGPVDLWKVPGAIRCAGTNICATTAKPDELAEVYSDLDWVICGGESGPRKRSTDLGWHRSLRDQCAAAGVAFFEKQIDKVQPIPDDLMIRQFPRVAA